MPSITFKNRKAATKKLKKNLDLIDSPPNTLAQFALKCKQYRLVNITLVTFVLS